MSGMPFVTSHQRPSFGRFLYRLVLACVAVFGLSAVSFAQETPKEKPVGSVKIEQIQVAFIGSGALGGGTMNVRGQTYKIEVARLGIGGFGASRLEASGEVYGLKDIADFAGPYVELRTGWAIGDQGKGRFWLRNAKGVLLKLQGTRQGLQVAAGAEGVIITFE